MKRLQKTLLFGCLLLTSAGCYLMDDGSSEGGYDGYDSMGGYHETSAVRQSLTREAPGLNPSGPGYVESSGGYSASCLVHAECGADEVCAADPACPEYTYCYALDEPEAEGCDCGDRYYSVCFEGECVLRGTDCGQGCPAEAGYACGDNGLCVCVADECTGWEPPPEVQQTDAGQDCQQNMDCPVDCICVSGSCVSADGDDGADDAAAESCVVSDDCGYTEYCMEGTCMDSYCESSDECGGGAVCRDKTCVDPGTLQVGDACSTNGQCKTAFCGNGKCRQLCDTNADCGDYECQEPPHHDLGDQTYCWGPRCGDCRDNEYCTIYGECQDR